MIWKGFGNTENFSAQEVKISERKQFVLQKVLRCKRCSDLKNKFIIYRPRKTLGGPLSIRDRGPVYETARHTLPFLSFCGENLSGEVFLSVLSGNMSVHNLKFEKHFLNKTFL